MASSFPFHLGLCCHSTRSERTLRLSDVYWLWTTLLTLNILDIRIGFINAGNGPFMPHVILAVFGVIAGGILLNDNRTHQKWFIGVMAVILMVSLSQLDFYSTSPIQMSPVHPTVGEITKQPTKYGVATDSNRSGDSFRVNNCAPL